MIQMLKHICKGWLTNEHKGFRKLELSAERVCHLHRALLWVTGHAHRIQKEHPLWNRVFQSIFISFPVKELIFHKHTLIIFTYIIFNIEAIKCFIFNNNIFTNTLLIYFYYHKGNNCILKSVLCWFFFSLAGCITIEASIRFSFTAVIQMNTIWNRKLILMLCLKNVFWEAWKKQIRQDPTTIIITTTKTNNVLHAQYRTTYHGL